jgi:YHS domain-containing protein
MPRVVFIRRTAALVACLGLSVAVLTAQKVNTSFTGLAIGGYDPVAYFTHGKPVKGQREFSSSFEGATYRFASAAHRELFLKDPKKYVPQYGAFCAWAVSRGYTADTDPEAWRIVSGKLYLNYNVSVQKQWEQDIPGNIGKADTNWPGLSRQ